MDRTRSLPTRPETPHYWQNTRPKRFAEVRAESGQNRVNRASATAVAI